MVIYDITREKTFESIGKWVDEIKQHCDPDVVLMLVGNKLDLAKDENLKMRRVKTEIA